MYLTKFHPVSNQGDWATWVLMSDRASGQPLDLSSLSFALAAVRQQGCDALTGSSSTGELTNPSTGYLQIFFPVARMQALPPGSYKVGLTMSNGAYTRQLILGLLPVVSGVVNMPGYGDDYS
jgi:hypothetical protein